MVHKWIKFLVYFSLNTNPYDQFYRYVATKQVQYLGDVNEVPREQKLRRESPENKHSLKFCALDTSLTQL